MMRMVLACCAAAVALGGCCKNPPVNAIGTGLPVNVAKVKDLSVTLGLNRQQFQPGETVDVTVTAENLTANPLTIGADSGALVIVRLLRYDGVSWRDVRRYPQAAAQVMTPWNLGPYGKRIFRMQLRIEPDWPVAETLRLTACLNGRPDVQPGLDVVVHPFKAPAPKAATVTDIP